jgi:hypothetical protein
MLSLQDNPVMVFFLLIFLYPVGTFVPPGLFERLGCRDELIDERWLTNSSCPVCARDQCGTRDLFDSYSHTQGC